MYKTILFDLDGTLTDPGKGITRSVAYALKAMGRHDYDRSLLESFIGPPLADSYRHYFGFSDDECQRGITLFREYFGEKGKFENEVYQGIPSLLNDLKTAGIRLAVATSKPTVFAEEILGYFGLSDFFDFVGGSNLDNTRTAKADVIDWVLDGLGRPDRSGILMVGDRKYDLIGAAAHGIDGAGVLYGYGSREELEGENSVFLAESPGAFGRFISDKSYKVSKS